jgi:hypothetical protein
MRNLILITMLVSCGSDNNSGQVQAVKVGDNEIKSLAINTAAELPECNEANKSQLIYVIELKEFQVCDATKWAAIDIKGSDGKDGANGSNGTNGSDGMSIAKIFDCDGSEDLDDSAADKHASHSQWTQFTDGSWMGTCGASYFGSYHSVSHETQWYPSNSLAVKVDQKLGCIPTFVTARFNTLNKTVDYESHSDSNKETVTCSEVYSR